MEDLHNGAAYGEPRDATLSPPSQSALARLRTAHSPEEVERLADELANGVDLAAWTGAFRAELIEALILQLAVDSIRDDPDAEDAICGALEQIGVMTRVGNLVFEFVSDASLPANDRASVRRYGGWLPQKYAPSPSQPAAEKSEAFAPRR